MARDSSAAKLIYVFEEFRKLNPDISVTTALVFVTVAEAGPEGIQMSDIRDRYGMSHGSYSRNIALLSVGYNRNEGFGVVRAEEDPDNRKQKIATLTQKGLRVWNSIKEYV